MVLTFYHYVGDIAVSDIHITIWTEAHAIRPTHFVVCNQRVLFTVGAYHVDSAVLNGSEINISNLIYGYSITLTFPCV